MRSAVGIIIFAAVACDDARSADIEVVLDSDPGSSFSRPRHLQGVGFTYRGARPHAETIHAERGPRLFFGELYLSDRTSVIIELQLPEDGYPARIRYREISGGFTEAVGEAHGQLQRTDAGYRFEFDVTTNDGLREVRDGWIWIFDEASRTGGNSGSEDVGCGGEEPIQRSRPPRVATTIHVVDPTDSLDPDAIEPTDWTSRAGPRRSGAGCAEVDGDDDGEESVGCSGDGEGADGCSGDEASGSDGYDGCSGDAASSADGDDGCSGDETDHGGCSDDDGCSGDTVAVRHTDRPRRALAGVWTRFGPVAFAGLVNRRQRRRSRSKPPTAAGSV